MEQLKKGDLVVLKSGGPDMTVKHKMSDGTWQCSWFDSGNNLKEGVLYRRAISYLQK